MLCWLRCWQNWLRLCWEISLWVTCILPEYGFCPLNLIACLRGCCPLAMYVHIFNVCLSSSCSITLWKRMRQSLSVIQRGVTDHWPTHSSTYTGMLLLQIAPIDPLTFCLQSSSKVSVVWITQTWWEFTIQSMLFGKIMCFEVLDFQGCFCHRTTLMRALHNALLKLFQYVWLFFYSMYFSHFFTLFMQSMAQCIIFHIYMLCKGYFICLPKFLYNT